jgi:hypothetical protein
MSVLENGSSLEQEEGRQRESKGKARATEMETLE